jgi:mRNA-degrading endonuclease RelE of RelBE toxin-antitoxin system
MFQVINYFSAPRWGYAWHSHSLNHLRSLRVGDYRMLYHLDHEARIVSVAAIGHRRYIDDDES